MFRKVALALIATAAVGAVSLTVSTAPAEAGWKKHHHHHWHGKFRYFHPAYGSYGYYGGCYRKRVVHTPWGPKLRTVNICY